MSMDRTQQKSSRTHPLSGHFVTFTGTFAALTRRQAVAIIERHGGVYEPHVTRKTSLLVVGLSGFPLLKDGAVSHKLARATALSQAGQTLEIVREDELYDRLELLEPKATVCRVYRLDQIPALTGVSVRRVQSWLRAGLIHPANGAHGHDEVPSFDYRQIASLKKLNELSLAGVTPSRLRQSLSQLSTWFPEANDLILRLDAISRRRVVMRADDDSLIDSAGQRVWDFDAADGEYDREPIAAYSPRTENPDVLFDEGVVLEADDQFEEAEVAYRRWLSLFGADADVNFNLANVLRAQGRTDAALERYRQSVELRPTYSEAWLNLGDLLAELDCPDEALSATRRAVELDPTSSAGLYNLASLLDELGRTEEARRSWEAFLRLESIGEFADYARARLSHAS